MLNNNVTFEARPLYKMAQCSALRNGEIQIEILWLLKH